MGRIVKPTVLFLTIVACGAAGALGGSYIPALGASRQAELIEQPPYWVAMTVRYQLRHENRPAPEEFTEWRWSDGSTRLERSSDDGPPDVFIKNRSAGKLYTRVRGEWA